MTQTSRPLAVVTGASSGIGYELAKLCAQKGYDLLIASDEAAIRDCAQQFRQLGAATEAVEADLSTIEGVDKLYAALHDRPVAALLKSTARCPHRVRQRRSNCGFASPEYGKSPLRRCRTPVSRAQRRPT
jgi:NAD(P)-dependent dehydrogenase (short-subunit alcohol dehydrogenase family)